MIFNILDIIPKIPQIPVYKVLTGKRLIVVIIIVAGLMLVAELLGKNRQIGIRRKAVKQQTKIMVQQAQASIDIITQIIGEIDVRINQENDPSMLIMIRDKLYTLKYELVNGSAITINPSELSMTYQQIYQDYDSRIVGLFRELGQYIN